MLRAPPSSTLTAGAGAAARPPASVAQNNKQQRQGRQAEALRLRRVFEMFDRDGDGVVTPAELSGALGRLAAAPARHEVDAAVAAYIAPGMAGLRFADFEALHAELAGGRAMAAAEEEMREAFGVFDEDGDGYISAAELQAVLSRMGVPEAACMARVRDMIAAADRDSDGRVDYDEFKAMMAAAAN
uniref:EF-hand domain-containing protein n=1 Tax=Leersia perrieri TaxID=77586 RepID=A0A0D9WF14_9ORYZ